MTQYNMAKTTPNVSLIPTKDMVKLRIAGMSFGSIALAAGISRNSVRERLKAFAPDRMDLGEFTRNEGHYYKLEEVSNLALGSMLRDKAMKDLIQHEVVNGRAIDCATRLFTSAAILFDKRRLVEGKSTANNAHFGTFYLKAEDIVPDYAADDALDVTPTPTPLIKGTSTPTQIWGGTGGKAVADDVKVRHIPPGAQRVTK